MISWPCGRICAGKIFGFPVPSQPVTLRTEMDESIHVSSTSSSPLNSCPAAFAGRDAFGCEASGRREGLSRPAAPSRRILCRTRPVSGSQKSAAGRCTSPTPSGRSSSPSGATCAGVPRDLVGRVPDLLLPDPDEPLPVRENFDRRLTAPAGSDTLRQVLLLFEDPCRFHIREDRLPALGSGKTGILSGRPPSSFPCGRWPS